MKPDVIDFSDVLHLAITETVTVSAGAGAGTSPTSVGTAEGANDSSGGVTLITGTSCSANETVCTVQFYTPFPGGAITVIVPGNAAAAAVAGSVYISPAYDQFYIKVGSTPLADSTLYKWFYHVIGMRT